MKVYELSEFIFLLRLGLWGGGEIAGLGHVSRARNAEGTGSPAGLTGLWLGGGVMLERSRSNSCGGMEMTFSVYDPYTGDHTCFTAAAGCEGNMEEVLSAIIAETERENRFGPRLPKEYVSPQSKRRYSAEYTSWRGSAPAAKRRR